MAATNLLALVFFSQLILSFTSTSRPCVGNDDGNRLSVMAASFGVPIPLTRRLLSVGFARSRFPATKSSKHGLMLLLIPGHDPVDITIFIDVPKNPGPYASTCSRLSCSDLSSDLSRNHVSNRNLHIRQIQVPLQYSQDQLKRFQRHTIIDTTLIAVLKDNDIFRYCGKRLEKRVKERQDSRSQRQWENLNCLNGTHLHSDVNNVLAFSSRPSIQPKASIPSLLTLECVACQNNTDVICVTESWLTNDVPVSAIAMSDFMVFQKDQSVSCGGGLVVCVNSTIRCKTLSQFANPGNVSECLWLQLRPCRLPRSVSSVLLATGCHMLSPL